jgi:hypothetical protein
MYSGWSVERLEGKKKDSKVVRLVKYWMQDCVVDGLKAKTGDRKKTWEVGSPTKSHQKPLLPGRTLHVAADAGQLE